MAAALCLGGLLTALFLLLAASRFLLFSQDDDGGEEMGKGEGGDGPLLLPLLTVVYVAGASLASTYLVLEEAVVRLLDALVRVGGGLCLWFGVPGRAGPLVFIINFDRDNKRTVHYRPAPPTPCWGCSSATAAASRPSSSSSSSRNNPLYHHHHQHHTPRSPPSWPASCPQVCWWRGPSRGGIGR